MQGRRCSEGGSLDLRASEALRPRPPRPSLRLHPLRPSPLPTSPRFLGVSLRVTRGRTLQTRLPTTRRFRPTRRRGLLLHRPPSLPSRAPTLEAPPECQLLELQTSTRARQRRRQCSAPSAGVSSTSPLPTCPSTFSTSSLSRGRGTSSRPPSRRRGRETARRVPYRRASTKRRTRRRGHKDLRSRRLRRFTPLTGALGRSWHGSRR